MNLPKLIILDRDGVINKDSDNYIKTIDEFIPYESSLQAIALINAANISVTIATNQSGIARKFYNLDTLNQMHHKLSSSLDKLYAAKIDKIFYCPHGPDDDCLCRKPKPAMLQSSLDYFNTSPDDAIFVGDSISDLLAAEAANIDAILVRTGKGLRTLNIISTNTKYAHLSSIPVYDNLLDFINYLLNTKTD